MKFESQAEIQVRLFHERRAGQVFDKVHAAAGGCQVTLVTFDYAGDGTFNSLAWKSSLRLRALVGTFEFIARGWSEGRQRVLSEGVRRVHGLPDADGLKALSDLAKSELGERGHALVFGVGGAYAYIGLAERADMLKVIEVELLPRWRAALKEKEGRFGRAAAARFEPPALARRSEREGRRMSKCVVCSERKAKGGLLCEVCSKAYDSRATDGTVWELIAWTAKRARRFETRRARAEQKRRTDKERAERFAREFFRDAKWTCTVCGRPRDDQNCRCWIKLRCDVCSREQADERKPEDGDVAEILATCPDCLAAAEALEQQTRTR